MAFKRKRGKCPYCGHRKALTNAGKIWAHKDGNGNLCGGHRPAAGDLSGTEVSAVMSYEDDHRVALAREMTAAAGFPLRDRYGFAASDESVLFVVNAVFAEPDDRKCGDKIGLANTLGEIQIAEGYDMPASEDYEQGIIRALRPLAEDRRKAAARSLR